MGTNSILTIIVLVVVLIIVLNSKPFKVWKRGRNKTEEQMLAIKYLYYGPEKSPINTDDYDVLCHEMYPDNVLFEKAKAKLGITDADIVTHPYDKIGTTHLIERNYRKPEVGEDVLIYQISGDRFRSSKIACLMVIFGKEKLYFYQFTYMTDRTEENEESYAYTYDEIISFQVSKSASRNKDSVFVSFTLTKAIQDEEETTSSDKHTSEQIDNNGANFDSVLKSYVEDGKRMVAIKLYQEKKQTSLKEAMEYINSLDVHSSPDPVQEEDQPVFKPRKYSEQQTFPSMFMSTESFVKWEAVGTHLDSTELKLSYKGKDEDEKNVIRYFKAYYNLPLALTDSEYESLISKTLPAEELRITGMEKMGIEEKDVKLSPPIAFSSFIYAKDTMEIQGRDQSWRSNAPQHTWLFFGKHQIYVNVASILMDSHIKQEATQEIFYKDITCIKSEETSTEKTVGGMVYRLSYYRFTILFGGDSLSLTLPILTDENDKKIRAMRNLRKPPIKDDLII